MLTNETPKKLLISLLLVGISLLTMSSLLISQMIVDKDLESQFQKEFVIGFIFMFTLSSSILFGCFFIYIALNKIIKNK